MDVILSTLWTLTISTQDTGQQRALTRGSRGRDCCPTWIFSAVDFIFPTPVRSRRPSPRNRVDPGRGPRQFGKSTWIEGLAQDHPGVWPWQRALSHGDHLATTPSFRRLRDPRPCTTASPVRRLFIDEITAVRDCPGPQASPGQGFLRKVGRDHRLESNRPRRAPSGCRAEASSQNALSLPARFVFRSSPAVCGTTREAAPAAYLLSGAPSGLCRAGATAAHPEWIIETTRDLDLGECAIAGRQRTRSSP